MILKRRLIVLFSIRILLGTASTSLASRNVKAVVKVDGNMMVLDKVNIQVDTTPVQTDVPAVNFDGRTLVPIRFVSESLGANVDWDNNNAEAIIKTSEKEIRLKVNSTQVSIDGVVQNIPYEAKTKLMTTPSSDGARTMVPLRFVSEVLGAQVEWINETSTADITSKGQIKPVPVPVPKPEPTPVPVPKPEPTPVPVPKPEPTPVPVPKPEPIPVPVPKPLPIPQPEISATTIKSITTRTTENSLIPKIHIEADGQLNYKVIQEPTRLVIDIEKAKIGQELNLNVDNGLVRSVKAVQTANTNTEKNVRVIIELNKFVAFEINKGSNTLDVSFVNSIEQIVKETINGKEAIVIKNAHASKTHSFFLSEPDRLVLDIRNTNLNGVSCLVKTDIIKEIRLGQYTGKEYEESEKVTRVVLDINESYENARLTSEIRGSDLIIFVEGNKKIVVTPPVVNPTPPSQKNGKVIVIDAGHGAHDSGAVSQGVKEKDLALKVSLKTQVMLENMGYTVLMTRTTDTYPSLGARSQLANNNNADAFLSVHFNAAGSTATGIETLYSTKNSKNKAFAQSLQNELVKELNPVDRGLKLRNNLAVLNGTKGISALAELGFISNPRDLKEINTDSYLTKCAKALADGIHSFFFK